MALVVALALPMLLMCGMSAVMCYDFDSWGPMGFLNRILTIYFPRGFTRILLLIPGGRYLHTAGHRAYNYMFNKPNPILQGFFLLLVLGGFAIFVFLGMPLIPNSRLSPIHLVLPFNLLLFVLYTFVLASTQHAGRVTVENQDLLESICPYDGFLFPRNKMCTTCGVKKVARSKHCRMQQECVAQFDHFCPWINNTVGALNFRYFLFFLVATTAFLLYGAYVFSMLLLSIVDRDRLWDVEFSHSSMPNTRMKADALILIQFLLANHSYLSFVLILCVVMGTTLFFFTLYQFYMVKLGVTSNESAKWNNVLDFYASAKWKRELQYRTKEQVQVVIDASREDSPKLDERLVKDFPNTIPANVYNLGFKENLRRVMFPPMSLLPPTASAPHDETTTTTTTAKMKKKKKM